MSNVRRCVCVSLLTLFVAAGTGRNIFAAEGPPKVGETVPDFSLSDLEGKATRLSEVRKTGAVVLVVLRGYPGYQCPLCSRQVGDFVAQGARFREAGATVLFVYPGPAANLKANAKEFVAEKKLPEGFRLLLDPDFQFTNSWGLRWEAPNETAYPSTFVIGQNGVVRFARISRTHGGRVEAKGALEALAP